MRWKWLFPRWRQRRQQRTWDRMNAAMDALGEKLRSAQLTDDRK